MAQNITFMGADYPAVPSVVLPKTGGGTASFTDVSDTTAAASDVASGKYFYTANGEKTEGTGSGGGQTTITSLSVTSNGTYTAPEGTAYSPVTVSVSGGGDPELGDYSVFFIDYDGTMLYRYTAVEAQALTELPANPTHTGLVGLGWNWTLAEIKSQLTNVGGDVWVGQLYTTTSGATEIDVGLTDAKLLSPTLSICPKGNVTVDWGDGSTSTVTGTSLSSEKKTQHIYASTGNYTISVLRTQGDGYRLGGSSSSPVLLGDGSSTAAANYMYSTAITAVRMGDYAYIGPYSFSSLYCLRSVAMGTLSNGNIAQYVFANCNSIGSITFPKNTYFLTSTVLQTCCLKQVSYPPYTSSKSLIGFTNSQLKSITIPQGYEVGPSLQGATQLIVDRLKYPQSLKTHCSFYSCQQIQQQPNIPSTVTELPTNHLQGVYLSSITIPSNITKVGGSCFSYNRALSSITIPATVTDFTTTSAFAYCSGLKSATVSATFKSNKLDGSMFNGCYSLTSFTIPNTCVYIGASAFSSCTQLSSMTIPATVTEIGNSAFDSCYGMREYHFKGTTPPTFGTNVFKNIPQSCVIYVPSSAVDAYKTATNMTTYASKIVGE